MPRPLALLLAVLALAFAWPAAAGANGGMEVGIADDASLLNEPDPAKQEAIVAQWSAVGITNVRLFAEWYKMVPDPLSPQQPADFNLADPNDPRYGFSRLERAISLVRAAGMTASLTVTGPAPVWATEEPSRGDPRWRPDPAKFGVFAGVVAKRLGAGVARYIIWNEPNVVQWLRPQATCSGRRCTPFSPHHYRKLFQAAEGAIRVEDPGADIAFGALAPRGQALRSRNAQMKPLQFLRALGCVTNRLRRDRRGGCAGFRPLQADAFAYHPHSILLAPDVPSGKVDDANMAELRTVQRLLDAIQVRGGLRKRGTTRRFPLLLTEWGYQTNPPDRLLGVSRARQARYLQQGTFIAWRDPRVQILTQYLWKDEPVRGRGTTLGDYAGWQSGVFDERGRAKPALRAFSQPFWVEARPGGRAVFWGQVRFKANRPATVRLQQRVGSRWRTIATPRPNRLGYWHTTRRLGRTATFRFVAGSVVSPTQRVAAQRSSRSRR